MKKIYIIIFIFTFNLTKLYYDDEMRNLIGDYEGSVGEEILNKNREKKLKGFLQDIKESIVFGKKVVFEEFKTMALGGHTPRPLVAIFISMLIKLDIIEKKDGDGYIEYIWKVNNLESK